MLTEETKNKYLELCMQTNVDLLDYKIHNKSMKALAKIHNDVFLNFKEESSLFLKSLLNNDEVRIRMSSAAKLLGLNLYTKEAIKTLNAIVKMYSGNKDEHLRMIAFNSEMTVEVWKKQGYLKF